MSYSYNLIYDSNVFKLKLWAFLISMFFGDYVSITKAKDLAENLGNNYAALKTEELNKSIILVIDFEVAEDFEALDESYINSVSDKRIYTGKEAIEKCLILNPLVRKLFFGKINNCPS